ncbi:MAG TPA: hypothetical protein VF801_05055 [Rhodocyclaceae bacterium]
MKKPPEAVRSWVVRALLAAALLSAAGQAMTPVAAPLMCKIYG